MLAHHKRNLGSKAIPIFQQAVNEDPELCIEAQPQITAAVYAMRKAIVRFDTQLGNISYFPRSQAKWKTDTDGGK
jgi:hypothetical protein